MLFGKIVIEKNKNLFNLCCILQCRVKETLLLSKACNWPIQNVEMFKYILQ